MTVKKMSALALGAVAAMGLMGAAAFAQDTVTGVRALNDRLNDVERDIREDMDRANDAARFGNPEFRPGFSGSASLGYSGKTGNNETQDLSVGIRLRHSAGPLVQTLGAVLDFQEANGVKTKQDVFTVYDANYYLNDQFYVFGMGRLQTDGLATTAGDIRRDGFIGVGPGYRFLNTPSTTWRAQLGIGVSYIQDGARNSTTETGYIASSRFFHQFSDTMFVTNDTDVLKSDRALRVNNDLGLNFRMTNALSTRISYLSEYNDSRAIRTDNKLGVSVVFGF